LAVDIKKDGSRNKKELPFFEVRMHNRKGKATVHDLYGSSTGA